MIKLADTLAPMADFPAVMAEHTEFADGESLQEKLDNGALGGGGASYKQLSQAEYDALTDDEKMDGREYRTYDTGHIYKLGIEYGKDGVQISDNETVENKTWSSSKTSDEIDKITYSTDANECIPALMKTARYNLINTSANVPNSNYSWVLTAEHIKLSTGQYYRIIQDINGTNSVSGTIKYTRTAISTDDATWTWSEWTKFLTEKEYYNALDYGNPIIPQDADLNDYLTPGVYACTDGTIAKTLANCPHIDSNFKLIVNKNRGNSDIFYGYQMIVGTVGGNPVKDVCIYYRGVTTSSDGVSAFSKWKIMSGSTVADVPKTTLTPVFPSGVKVASAGVAIYYIVRNGWCNVNFVFHLSSATTFEWTEIATGLPKPANNVNMVLINAGGEISRTIFAKIDSTGSVSSKVSVEIGTADWWTCNISYPVAES